MSMLEGAPWLLAHRTMLEANKPIKVSLYGCDYVLWKDRTGKVGALPNTCPHMGAMLSEGWCHQQEHSSAVVCPFHALEFDTLGCTTLPGTKKKTLPQLEPLKLIIQDDFIWSYGGKEPKAPIPEILTEIASKYEYIGYTGDTSVETDLIGMLLIMHDYNHLSGTHRPLFRIKEVNLESFIDRGHLSHVAYNMPTTEMSLGEKLRQPDLFLIPKVIEAHLDNYFPSIVVFYSEIWLGKIAQIHISIPESSTHTRTYVLLYGLFNSPAFKVFGKALLNFAKAIVEQDADIHKKIYQNMDSKIKLNNEIGMDWVKRNVENWPSITEPNLSK